MRSFVVGDIHGDAEQLERLLERIPYDPQGDELIFLGDYVDRGPDAKRVVEIVMDLVERGGGRTIALRGNHEAMMLAALEGEQLARWILNGGGTTVLSYGGSIEAEESDEGEVIEVDFDLPDEHVRFVESLPYWYENEHAIYVHAGLSAGRSSDQLVFPHPREQDPETLLWSRDPRFWRWYAGKRIVFGHSSTVWMRAVLGEEDGGAGVWMTDSLVALDTGCGKSPTGVLTCLELPALKFYSVAS